MHSYSTWKHADKPNYSTNFDLVYPYSEIPHKGHQTYLKIPVTPTDMIKHVDYWGEGRIISGEGIYGFPKSYNVNHQYRLVSSGPDKDKKIPNRIPLVSYTDCDTSAFIKDNSVLIVTIPGARINSNCARDIARMINEERGKVVVYGTHGNSKNISELTAELKVKGLLTSENAILDSELLGLTYFDSHVAFITSGKNEKDIKALKEDLFNYVKNGNYDAAVHISKLIGEGISEVVTKLIRHNITRKVMLYAYKLWYADDQGVVRKHLPTPFRVIMNKGNATISNKGYGYTVCVLATKAVGIKLDENTSTHNSDTRWIFIPDYHKGQLAFKLFHVQENRYLMQEKDDGKNKGVSSYGTWRIDNKVLTYGGFKFLLDPSIGDDGKVAFAIISAGNEHLLKMDEEDYDFGNDVKGRLIRGFEAKIYKETDTFKWIVEQHFAPVLLNGNFVDVLDSD